MSRTSRLSILSGTALAVAALAAAPTAQAYTYDIAETVESQGTVEVQTDWGVNKYGWEIRVINDRSEAVDYLSLESLGVKTVSAASAEFGTGERASSIPSGKVADVKGTLAPISGTMAIFGKTGSLDNRFVHVRKSGVTCGTFENNGFGDKVARNGVGCEIVSDDLQNIIEVRFVD